MSTIFNLGRPEQPGLAGLVRELFIRVSDLIYMQVELIKAEAKIGGKKLAMASLFGLVALTIGSIFLMLVGLSMVLILSQYLNFVWAAVITTATFLFLTAIFGWLTIWELKRNTQHIDV